MICRRRGGLFLMMAVLGGSASAEWSSDPSVNLIVFGGAGNQSQPKVALDGFGNTWISCFSMESAGGDTLQRVRLQRLDLLGNPFFPTGGVILGEHSAMSWTSDYGMMTDASGNVFVCYAAAGEGGQSSVYANLATPDGSLPWGADGVEVFSDSMTESYSPRAIRTGDGGYVMAWTCEVSETPGFIRMQKLDGDGNLLWGDGIDLAGAPDQDLDWAWLTSSGEGFILSWVGRITTGSNLTVNGYLNRYDQDGAALWAQPVEYSSSGEMFEFTFPQTVSDGADGAFLAWEEYADRGSKTSRIQHVTSGGTSTMAAGGTPVSTATVNSHSGPAMAFLPTADDLAVFWVEWNDYTLDHGIYTQHFSPYGAPALPDTGLAIIDLIDNTYFGLTPRLSVASDVLCVYGYVPGASAFSHLKAMLVAQDGSPVWDDWPTVINDTEKDKGGLEVTELCWGQQWVLAWGEIRGADMDVFAQNIKLDGTLGSSGLGMEGGVCDGALRVLSPFPNPCSDAVTVRYVASGESCAVLRVFDMGGRIVLETSTPGSVQGLNEIPLDLSDIGSGVYLFHLQQGGSSASGRLLVLD